MATEIRRRVVVLVEGQEEERFFTALTKHLGIETIQFLPTQGKNNLSKTLKVVKLSPGFQEVSTIGIVQDADSDPAAAFRSVSGALRANHLPVPERPGVVTGLSPKVSVLIMPTDGSPGMLEDLCLSSVHADAAMECVSNYFDCLRTKGFAEPAHFSKARVAVFLSSRERPGLRLGEAAESGFWPLGSDAFKETAKFLTEIGG